jgi:hypothetical protein
MQCELHFGSISLLYNELHSAFEAQFYDITTNVPVIEDLLILLATSSALGSP